MIDQHFPAFHFEDKVQFMGRGVMLGLQSCVFTVERIGVAIGE